MHIQPSILEDILRRSGRPIHFDRLLHATIAATVEAQRLRPFAPGEAYALGERVLLDGRSAIVSAVRAAANQRQGRFQAVTLRLTDGQVRRYATQVPGAPRRQTTVAEEHVRDELRRREPQWREALRKALDADSQVVHFDDGQGSRCYLRERLPAISTAIQQRARQRVLEAAGNNALTGVPTAALVKALWQLTDSDSAEFELRAFALSVVLAETGDLKYIAGAGWVSAAQWQQITERSGLVGPRKRTVLPAGHVTEQDGGAAITTPGAADSRPAAVKRDGRQRDNDLHNWQRRRPEMATVTLTASAYYGSMLPLNNRLRRLFPPRASRVTLHLRADGESVAIPALIAPGQKKVVADGQHLYEALRDHAVYPGTRLTLAHRGNLTDYDLMPKPAAEARIVLVRRLALNAAGELEIWEDEEPLRYDVRGDVFVADARWEDLDALFAQAEAAGNSIFGLMFAQCLAWQRESEEPLIVTADQLFEAIHFGPRLTSKNTIALELWRRQAFQPLGQGRYRFRPEKGQLARGFTRRRKQTTHAKPAQPSTSTPQPQPVTPPVPAVTTPEPPAPRPAPTGAVSRQLLQLTPSNWREALAEAVVVYKQDPWRENMRLLRLKAHERIRALLAEEQLDRLTLEAFNRHVWDPGTISRRGASKPLNESERNSLLRSPNPSEWRRGLETGLYTFEGNQTWGQGTRIYGTALRMSDEEKEKLLRQNLHRLLYGEGSTQKRIEALVRPPNGFGMNIITGLLQAFHGERYVLYNNRAVARMKEIGQKWPGNWSRSAAVYRVYRDFMDSLTQQLQLRSLTDTDLFLYYWFDWFVSEEGAVSFTPVQELERPGEESSADGQTSYFILKQRPDSEYDDTVGQIYNWRQGIPGSRQLGSGARFVYYRPGEKVFFGTGRIARVSSYTGRDGRLYYDGEVSNYRPWNPPLPLDAVLDVPFQIQQPGIQKIDADIYQAIVDRYRGRQS